MEKPVPKSLHPAAASLSLLTILAFWLSTLLTKLLGSDAQVVWLKTHLPWAFLLLIPALAVTGATGLTRAGPRRGRLIDAKRRRMPLIAANGLLILVPSALFLAARAGQGRLDATFHAVQIVELGFGAVNILLLGLGFRDGLRLTGRLRPRLRTS